MGKSGSRKMKKRIVYTLITLVVIIVVGNLEFDTQESYNVLNTYPDKGAELAKLLDEWEKTTTANPRGFQK